MGDRPDTLTFSIKLSSGDFESSLTVPLPRTGPEMERVVSDWLQLMHTGIRTNATEIKANLADSDKTEQPNG